MWISHWIAGFLLGVWWLIYRMGSQDNLQYTSIHPFRDGKGRRLCCRFSHKIDSLMQQNVINPSTSTINGCQWRILHCLLSISVAFQAFTRLLEHQVLGDTFKACFWYSKQPKNGSRTGSMSYYVSWITNFSNFLSYFGIEKKNSILAAGFHHTHCSKKGYRWMLTNRENLH